MSRFSPAQPDMFAPQAPPPPAAPETDALGELQALLAMLRAAETMPWPDVGAVMAEERRALGLARLAGAAGEALAAAIMDETERLFRVAEARGGADLAA